MKLIFLSLACFLVAHSAATAQQTLLRDESMHHLRIDGPREWASFPERPEASHLRYEIQLSEVPDALCLQLRQLDVKQTWRVLVNGNVAARLPIDENDMRVYFDLPVDHWQAGRNELRIEQDPGRAAVDDVRIGDLQLVAAGSTALLNRARLTVQVRDTDTGRPSPTRITILDQHGSLQTVGVDPSASSHLAVRPGTIYSATGEAAFGVPARGNRRCCNEGGSSLSSCLP